MTTSFSPESWDKAGAAFSDDGAEFRSQVAAVLSGMDVAQLNSLEGGTAIDTAISMLVPTLLSAFTETAEGIAGGLAATGEGLTGVAGSYREVEAANAEGGAGMVPPGEG